MCYELSSKRPPDVLRDDFRKPPNSIPALSIYIRRRGSMVEHQPSKLKTWVRFPSPALQKALGINPRAFCKAMRPRTQGFGSRLSARSAHRQRSAGPYAPHRLLFCFASKIKGFTIFCMSPHKPTPHKHWIF